MFPAPITAIFIAPPPSVVGSGSSGSLADQIPAVVIMNDHAAAVPGTTHALDRMMRRADATAIVVA